MGSVAVTFRVMPDDPETDLERLKSRIRERLTDSLRDLREQPVAFGLTGILDVALASDAEGGSDRLEETLAAIPGVGSVETIDVTLVWASIRVASRFSSSFSGAPRLRTARARGDQLGAAPAGTGGSRRGFARASA